MNKILRVFGLVLLLVGFGTIFGLIVMVFFPNLPEHSSYIFQGKVWMYGVINIGIGSYLIKNFTPEKK